MAWQPNEQVTFVSHSGDRSTRILDDVTGEGFAVLKINGGELVFTPSGNPINDYIDPLTKGPRLQKIKGQTISKGSFNDPWHNEFALQTFTINELKKMLDILIEDKHGNKKLNLSSHKDSANIKEMFNKKKPKGATKKHNKPKRNYRKKSNGSSKK